MEDEYVAIYDYKDSSSENPDWIWHGTLKHIASLGLAPILGTKKYVPVAKIDETGRYQPERGTGQR